MATIVPEVTLKHLDYYSGERVAHGYITIDSGNYPLAGLAFDPDLFGMSQIDSIQFAKKTGFHELRYQSGSQLLLMNYPGTAGGCAAIGTTTFTVALGDYWFTVHGK